MPQRVRGAGPAVRDRGLRCRLERTEVAVAHSSHGAGVALDVRRKTAAFCHRADLYVGYQRRMKKIKKDTKLRLDSEAIKLLTPDPLKQVAGGATDCDMGATCVVTRRSRVL
jgi:hypothetical protein